MRKYLESAARLEELSRIVSSAKPQRPKGALPRSPNRVAATPRSANPSGVKVEPAKKMEALEECRTPLAKVVADCAKRWFQDTLKEAKAGDSAMQLLVGQMYYSGYGVPRDPQKGHVWISKASRSRNSVWKVCGKRPGYRASDSDSCEQENKDKSSP
ncbi:Sel protein [Spatholobus suberectus]|nr:Sel protein [Spatholobus suberectus]